jgi:glyoxylate reductase
MATVFVTRRIPDAGLRLLECQGLEVVVGQTIEDRGLTKDQLLEGVAAADGLLCLLTEEVDREVLTVNPRLRGVSTFAVGYDNIDVRAATELGIPVSNTPGVLTDTTADLTWALLLAASRRIPEAHEYTREGRFRIWGPNLLLGTDVSPGGSGRRKVLGIVGFGRIGQAVARRARGFDMDVLVHTRGGPERVEGYVGVEWATMNRLLSEADFVSLHVPLTRATHHLIGSEELARMKPSAILVNTARGPIVDEAALVRALEAGRIGGAGLDVFEEEPAVHPGLVHLPNVVLAPHIGSASRDTRDRMARMAAEGLLHHLRGDQAPHTVNPDVYEGEPWRRRQETDPPGDASASDRPSR